MSFPSESVYFIFHFLDQSLNLGFVFRIFQTLKFLTKRNKMNKNHQTFSTSHFVLQLSNSLFSFVKILNNNKTNQRNPLSFRISLISSKTCGFSTVGGICKSKEKNKFLKCFHSSFIIFLTDDKNDGDFDKYL